MPHPQIRPPILRRAPIMTYQQDYVTTPQQFPITPTSPQANIRAPTTSHPKGLPNKQRKSRTRRNKTRNRTNLV